VRAAPRRGATIPPGVSLVSGSDRRAFRMIRRRSRWTRSTAVAAMSTNLWWNKPVRTDSEEVASAGRGVPRRMRATVPTRPSSSYTANPSQPSSQEASPARASSAACKAWSLTVSGSTAPPNTRYADRRSARAPGRVLGPRTSRRPRARVDNPEDTTSRRIQRWSARFDRLSLLVSAGQW